MTIPSSLAEWAAPGGEPWQNRVLDELDYGIVVLTPQLRVAYCNAAASRRLAEPSSPIVLGESALEARCSRDAVALHDALRGAMLRGWRRLLCLQAGSGVLTLAVVPLEGQCGSAASILLILGRRSACETLSIRALAQSLRLTAGETEVLSQLVAGHRPVEIAAQLSVALSTVRTHISNIRSKAGVASICELVDEAARLPPLTARLASQRVAILKPAAPPPATRSAPPPSSPRTPAQNSSRCESPPPPRSA